jgi:hypothetical protein
VGLGWPVPPRLGLGGVGEAGPRLVFQGDGNFVIYAAEGVPRVGYRYLRRPASTATAAASSSATAVRTTAALRIAVSRNARGRQRDVPAATGTAHERPGRCPVTIMRVAR